MGQHSHRASHHRHRHHRHRRVRSSSRRALRAFLLALAVSAVVFFVWRWSRTRAARTAPTSTVASSASNTAPNLLEANAAIESHPLFPYSVIPGGARSGAELENALMKDPVAAAHYAGFDVAKTHVVRLDRGRSVYVSYRIGDHIYWMSRKLWLPAGEAVLTDGEHEARTRCGNRISETPQLPVALVEPSRAMLDTPVAPELAATSETIPLLPIQPAIGGTDPLGGQTFIPPLIPIGGGSAGSPRGGTPSGRTPPGGRPFVPVTPPGGQPSVPVTPTPEPASLLLLSAGLLGVWAARKKPQQ